MKLKVMEYNILNGFCRRDRLKRHTFMPRRLEAAVKVVRDFDPDLLVLCEASIYSPHYLQGRGLKGEDFGQFYAKIFGYPHVYYGIGTISRNKKNQIVAAGSAVLSKYPISGENYSVDRVSFLRTGLEIAGNRVMLDIFHPHPRLTGDDKASFAKSIVKDRKSPYLLVGDFNSVSPEDEYDRKRLVRGFISMTSHYKMKENPIEIVNEILEMKAVSSIIDAGLIDSYRACHPEKDFVFTNPTRTGGFSDTAMRLDYIFCSPDIRVVDSGIIKNKLTDMASDHYPIYAVLDIPKI